MFISQNIKNLFLSTSLLLTYGISSVVATDSNEDTHIGDGLAQQAASHAEKKRTYLEISKINNEEEEPKEQGGSAKRAHTQTATNPNEYEYILPDFEETCDLLQNEFTCKSVSIKDNIINEIKEGKKEYIENVNLINKVSIDLLRKNDIQNLCALVLHSQGLFGNESVIESDISLTFIHHDKHENILLKNGYLCFNGENGASILSTLLTLRDGAAYMRGYEAILNRFQINNTNQGAFTLLETGFKKTDKIIGLSGDEFIHLPKSEASEINFESKKIFCFKGGVFHEYKELRKLNLSDNQLTQTPDVSNNPNLNWLNLSHNQLTQAPDLSYNPNLRELNLSDNQLTQTPDVSNNPNLEGLYLSYNQLTQGPDLSNNPNLNRLNLSHNQLTQCPNVSNNPNLNWLDLSHNQLTQGPNVSNNPNLVTLFVFNNKLSQTPNLSKNPNLILLNLSHNQLTQTPDVSNKPNLGDLNLSHNQLTQTPDVSSNLYLLYLYLSHNQLTQAPNVSKNPNLQWLDLSHNQLTQGPDVSNNLYLKGNNFKI